MARDFDRSGLFGLAEFIARLGELVQTQPREEQAATQPENADVVRLMTIHQAKGLEFPVVFVPDFAAVGRDAREPVARWDGRLGCVARPPADEEEPPFPEFGWRLWQAAEAVGGCASPPTWTGCRAPRQGWRPRRRRPCAAAPRTRSGRCRSGSAASGFSRWRRWSAASGSPPTQKTGSPPPPWPTSSTPRTA